MPSPTPAPTRARAVDPVRWIQSLAALALALALACKPEPSPETVEPRDPPAVDHVARSDHLDHGAARPYWGTWIGPTLRLGFVGPWVLIAPAEAGPGAQPIELRATIERQEGDAFALRTSVAERYAADFVRPSDWTLLVEAGELALAMGDEPLTTYAHDPAPLLVGPELLDEIAIPDSIAGEDVLACLETASEVCRALEADGPLAAGCREAQWAVCVAHGDRGQADPTVRSAIATAETIHQNHVAVRFAAGLHAAAPADPQAAAFHRRALARAEQQLAQLRADGPLPSDDPHLPALLAALREAGR